MLILAEICDKMPTITEMWLSYTVVATPLVAIAAVHRWAAVFAAVVAFACSAFFAHAAHHEAFLEGSFSQAVWSELGVAWVVHSIASTSLPFLLTVTVAIMRWNANLRRMDINCG